VSLRGALGALGRVTRHKTRELLWLLALTASVFAEALRPDNWRRPVRAEFRRSLRQAAGGGLLPVTLTAAITGFGMVYQALYWLAFAGQDSIAGRVLVDALIREVAPLLVGLILLGRSGMFLLVEIGAMQSGGQVRALAGLGLDPFRLLLLPRAIALAAAAFSLGIVFVAVALACGFVTGTLFGVVRNGPLGFLDTVLSAMQARDFLVFPAKLVLIGALVALTGALTALATPAGAPPATMLPLGFARGVLAVLVASILLTVTV